MNKCHLRHFSSLNEFSRHFPVGVKNRSQSIDSQQFSGTCKSTQLLNKCLFTLATSYSLILSILMRTMPDHLSIPRGNIDRCNGTDRQKFTYSRIILKADTNIDLCDSTISTLAMLKKLREPSCLATQASWIHEMDHTRHCTGRLGIIKCETNIVFSKWNVKTFFKLPGKCTWFSYIA